jgi:hypothetical protein
VQSKDFFQAWGRAIILPGSYLYSELCPIVAGIVTMDKKEVHVLQCD